MIKNDFSYYVRKFLTSYLPQERGYSENTIDYKCQHMNVQI